MVEHDEVKCMALWGEPTWCYDTVIIIYELLKHIVGFKEINIKNFAHKHHSPDGRKLIF